MWTQNWVLASQQYREAKRLDITLFVSSCLLRDCRLSPIAPLAPRLLDNMRNNIFFVSRQLYSFNRWVECPSIIGSRALLAIYVAQLALMT